MTRLRGCDDTCRVAGGEPDQPADDRPSQEDRREGEEVRRGASARKERISRRPLAAARLMSRFGRLPPYCAFRILSHRPLYGRCGNDSPPWPTEHGNPTFE